MNEPNPSLQIEVFSRILKTSVTTFLNSDEENLQKNMEECAKMVCHGQHTYVYAQVGIHMGTLALFGHQFSCFLGQWRSKNQLYKNHKHYITSDFLGTESTAALRQF